MVRRSFPSASQPLPPYDSLLAASRATLNTCPTQPSSSQAEVDHGNPRFRSDGSDFDFALDSPATFSKAHFLLLMGKKCGLLGDSIEGTRMTFTVRQADIRDLEQLVPLFDSYRQFYGRASDIRAARVFLLARFHNEESTVFIAHEGEKAIGFTQLYPSFSSISLARIFILNDLFVDEQSRRKGVASALMSAAVKFAIASGADRLSLSTAVTNDAAQGLYQSAGWKRDDEFLVYDFTIPT